MRSSLSQAGTVNRIAAVAAASSATSSGSHRAAQVRELNRSGVEQMRQGALEASLSTFHLALSMTTDITSGQGKPSTPPPSTPPPSTSHRGSNGSSSKGQASSSLREDDERLDSDTELIAARATTLSNLGCLYRRMGQLSEAMTHLQAARDLEAALQTDATGVSRSGSCSTMLNLCTVLIAMDRIEEALSVAYRCAERAAADAAALAVAAEPFGSKQPSAQDQAATATAAYLHALSLHNLAVAQQSSDKKEERRHASTTMLRALEVARVSLGDQHPTTVMLRVKCGVPNIPQAATLSPPAAALVPRAPGGAKPLMLSNKSSSTGRAEVDVARDALRQLGGSAVYEPIPQRPLTAQGDGGDAAMRASRSPSSQGAIEDVMRGAAFTDPRHDGSGPAASSGLTEDGHQIKTVDNDVQMLDIAAAQQQQQQQKRQLPPDSNGASFSTNGGSFDPLATIPTNGRLTASSDHLKVGSSTASPSVSQAQTPRRSPAARQQRQVVAHNVLVLERSALSSDRPPAFMRFAPNSAAAPPAPTTFGDIREELRLETALRRQAAAIQNRSAHGDDGRGGAAGSTIAHYGRHGGSKHGVDAAKGGATTTTTTTTTTASAVAQRKKSRAVQEEAEEVLLRQRMKADEQKAIVQAAQRVKQEALMKELRHKAARTIQRTYRRWWHRTGYNASLLRKKQQKSTTSSPAGSANSGKKPNASDAASSSPVRAGAARSGATAGSSGTANSIIIRHHHHHTKLSRAVVRCAQKWLTFCTRRLLLFRLSGGGGQESRLRVERNIRIAQRCWRSKIARRRAASMHSFNLEVNQRIVVTEERHSAARRIQGAYRGFKARREVERRSRDRYWRPVIFIQRWFRWHVGQRAKAGQRAQGMYYQTRAAVAIQRVWRGYLGRLRAVMLRLKRKVQIMRAKDASRSVAIQRIAKGFQTRRSLAKAQQSTDVSQRTKMIASLATHSSTPSAPPQQPPLPPPASEVYKAKALQQAAAVEALRNREREEQHIPVAVESQAARVRQEYTRLVPLEVRRERAAEMDRRDVELKTLQRHRAARVIQRYYRRWKRLCTAEASGRRAIASRSYERTLIQQKGAKALASTTQQKMRSLNDMGADARSLAAESRAEAEALETLVTRHLPTMSSSRPAESRAVDAREVKQLEVQLGREQREDNASLRAVPTFLTQRQRKLLVDQRDGEVALIREGGSAPAQE